MDDNNLLMIVLAFVVGFMLQGMMKNMCGGRLLEGYWQGWGEKCAAPLPPYCKDPLQCGSGLAWYSAKCSIFDKHDKLKVPSDCESGCELSDGTTVTCTGNDPSTCTRVVTTTLV